MDLGVVPGHVDRLDEGIKRPSFGSTFCSSWLSQSNSVAAYTSLSAILLKLATSSISILTFGNSVAGLKDNGHICCASVTLEVGLRSERSETGGIQVDGWMKSESELTVSNICLVRGRMRPIVMWHHLISIHMRAVFRTLLSPNLLWHFVCTRPIWLKTCSQLAELAMTLMIWIANFVKRFHLCFCPIGICMSIPFHTITRLISWFYMSWN